MVISTSDSDSACSNFVVHLPEIFYLNCLSTTSMLLVIILPKTKDGIILLETSAKYSGPKGCYSELINDLLDWRDLIQGFGFA